MLLISKAKAAKMVRELLDLFLDMEVSTGTEVGFKQNLKKLLYASPDWLKILFGSSCPNTVYFRQKKTCSYKIFKWFFKSIVTIRLVSIMHDYYPNMKAF